MDGKKCQKSTSKEGEKSTSKEPDGFKKKAKKIKEGGNGGFCCGQHTQIPRLDVFFYLILCTYFSGFFEFLKLFPTL
jgi:hypothetical protein